MRGIIRESKFIAIVAVLMALLVIPAIASAQKSSQPYAGQTLSVILPPWGNLPKSMVDQFEHETGIHLQLQIMGWDDIHTKIVTAEVAGTAPADVTEFDWSWVGQFGAAKWYAPLNQDFSSALIKDIAATNIFTYKGNLRAIPYSNDFRITIINKKMFKEAGITNVPQTLDELLADAKLLKQKIVKYPIGVPLSATEGASTPWYLLTKAFGGELFTKDWKPQFTDKSSAGYKAFEWEINALKAGLINPAETGLTDVQTQTLFKSGQIAIDLAGWPGNLPVYNDPSKSKVAGDVEPILVPGTGGKHRTFGLPEGLGIPANAKHKEAAVAFIKWWMQPANQIKIYQALGDLPTRTSVLQRLNKEGKLQGGTILLKQIPSVEPLFPQGTPTWYPEFSTAVASAVNQAAKGQISVSEAIDQIAQQAKRAASQ
jgi:multiple sugar transport system substrate-binding protein